MTSLFDAPSSASDLDGPDPKRWLALGIVAVAQLMVVLDASIVTIALPSAQHSLHISTGNRQWMITAYTLAFGGLLLLGGRIADYIGRKRAFIIGLLGFAAASALGGVAVSSGMLFGARALQGAFAALLAPAALSLITVTFTEVKERATAFGVYGAISGGGAAIGLILGGVLTEFASWRWCLLVNVPIAIIAALAALPVVRESRAHGNTSYDLPGAATITLGLVSLVYGFTKAATRRVGGVGHRHLLADRRGLVGGVRRHRAEEQEPSPPHEDHPGAHPGRLLPGVVPDRGRLARDVPVPDLLLPGEPALLGSQIGVRLPALLGRDHRRRRRGQQAPAQGRPPGAHDGRSQRRGARACSG